MQVPPLSEGPPATTWLPLVECRAEFPLQFFETAALQLINFPEYNSTLILRSESLSDTRSDFPSLLPRLDHLHIARNIHRRLLPRRPGRDAPLEQFCAFYTPEEDGRPTTLILTPIVPPGSSLPYYHPRVRHLAFRYIPTSPPILRLEVVPLPCTPTDHTSKVYRTCLALLNTLHKYGRGFATEYKKRVMHDCLVPKESYQDLYLVMRERHKGLVHDWHEVTDPLKHVFEDIGIATFLMLLWKDTFGDTSHSAEGEERPWDNWPRPPGGFLDMGCGNGLLTHILTAEGYDGYGIDVRARTSWKHYPDTTRARLRVHPFDPTTELADREGPLSKPGVFVVGNHADELTPWIPVVSTLCGASGYLSIPCCAWDFDARFERSSSVGSRCCPLPGHDGEWVRALNLGSGEGGHSSSYSTYRIWLASLSLYCGWEVECETLRIPSTRNWAVVGRRRTTADDETTQQNVNEILDRVRQRGLFKTRKPEGNPKDH